MWNLLKKLPHRLLHSLSFKLASTVGFILFLALAGAAWLQINQQKFRLEDRAQEQAEGFVDSVRQATYWSMLKNERESQHRIIQDLAKVPGIERIRVFNKDGQIMFSSQDEEIGRVVDMQAEACYGCHSSDAPLAKLPQEDRTRFFVNDHGERVLSTILPIYNEPVCSGPPCHFHPAQQKVLGVLDVAMNLAKVDQEFRHDFWRTLAFALGLFFAISTFIGVSVILTVNRSVKRLVTEAGKVAAGEHNLVELVSAPDELGEMAQAFNRMARQVALSSRLQDRRYRQLVLNSTDAVFLVDPAGRMMMANPEVARILGREAENLENLDAAGLVHPEDLPALQKAIGQAVKEDRASETVRFRVNTAGRGPRVLEGRFRPVEENHNLTGILGNLRDITERQAMEQELDRRRAFEQGLIDQALNAIMATDPRGVIQVFNQSAEELLGIPEHEVRGVRSYEEFFPRAQRRLLQKAIFDNPRPGVTLVRPAVVKTASGQRLPVMVSAFPLFIQGTFGGLVFFLQNLRESKRLKAQLLKKTRLAAVGQTAASMAHLIKNLLHGLGTSSYLVDQGLTDGDLELAGQGWRMIKRNLDQMEDLSQDLLAYAKDRRPEYQTFNLNRTLEEVAGLVAGRAAELDAEMVLKPDPACERVVLDPFGIRRVVLNFVTNALDALAAHTPPEGRRRVTISDTRDGCGQVIITVEDNGPGLSPEAREHLFHGMFSTKGSRGTGLGLLVSLKIVEEHGGTLEYTSLPGKGTRFTIVVPDLSLVAEGEGAPACSPPEPPPA
ncbi:MAG: PAS domain S-box protein [Deltaproteobacteria bacterium]|nr:PAS domain S-box protein [Deltaproteobacteria bacterium]